MKAYLNIRTYIICLLLALPFGSAMADEYSETSRPVQECR